MPFFPVSAAPNLAARPTSSRVPSPVSADSDEEEVLDLLEPKMLSPSKDSDVKLEDVKFDD